MLIRKLRTFLRMELRDKKVLLETTLLTAISRAIILSIPFNKYQKFIGKYNQETPFEIDANQYKTVKRIAWAVNIVSDYTPWESKCLVQAITAQKMLKSRNMCSTLYLGVNKDVSNVMKAHSWLRCGQFYVTGGHNKNEFKEVAKFANEVLHKEASIV